MPSHSLGPHLGVARRLVVEHGLGQVAEDDLGGSSRGLDLGTTEAEGGDPDAEC